ncbi:integrase [Runella defluvii]|uniref:Integrase n=1 Tax=Runella defluvii TaxID=370973 RepID=A0A7W5ZH37_9BACT|nr:site-specific integrase [Runella defluvii]MBB3836708.1 integrase [Runella defluvii]
MGKVITNQARFVLKEPNSEKPTLVYLICRTCVPRLKYSTGVSIQPSLWDSTTDRPTVQTKKFDRTTKEQLDEIRNHLNRIADAVGGINSRVKAEKIEPTPEFFRAELDKEFNLNKPRKVASTPEKLTLFSWVEKFIEECANGERTIPRTGKRYSESSIKNYKKTLNHLRAFQKKTRYQVDFDKIDLHFYQKLIKYLNDEGKATNTKGGIVKYVKVFMRQAMKDKMHTNTAFQDEDFVKPVEESENIYLTLDEIQRIYNLDLSARAGLDRVRDVFIIGCHTGLRFSDLNQLQPENFINDGKFVRVTTQKTDHPVYVPLKPEVRAILAKYDGIPPRVLTNQRMNQYLKEIAELAGLNEKVTITQTKGGLKVTKTRQKWELVTTHTARRSFATNAYKEGVPTIDIMRLTGHRTETSFMKYIKVTNEEVAHRMAEHPFFTQEKQGVFKIAN